MKPRSMRHWAGLEQEQHPLWHMLCDYAQCEREWRLGEHGAFPMCPQFSPNKNNC